MISGSTPAVVTASSVARPVSPRSRTSSSRMRTVAAAPSLIPEELPAVTDPSAANAGRSPASTSSVVPGRGCSSTDTSIGRLPPVVTGTISSANAARLASRAALR